MMLPNDVAGVITLLRRTLLKNSIFVLKITKFYEKLPIPGFASA
jgi:hypothetical protein